ncbi:HAD family hydrolase [Cyclobacterium plantarum]|uniref:HAD family phosphatase n=1 Tax=Cyclobacterium plantarum TaxID=2716263 RepID=A0ABX0HBH9_9BACT|nr:HAD family phosphatase [Cyclobacterium plantarum]NHE57797.1 HAD family phosphatase [Cyclobacterium plantarum]
MKKQAVIFDMDGVICHTNPYHSEAFRVFFGKRGLSPTEEEFAQHMYGKSNKYIFSHFLGRDFEGEEFSALENEKEGLFRQIYASKVETIPGFLPFLDDLKTSGFRTGVATSAPAANLELIMGTLGFGPKMESILASEHVKKHKPDPEVYLTSARNMGMKPENCLVFEDSFSGVSAARNAGMQVIGVLSSHSKEELPPCNLYIEDFHEVNARIIADLLT